MNMEKFVEAINLEMKEIYPGAEVRFTENVKSNDRKLMGMTVRLADEICCPVIYLDEYAKAYDEGKSIKEISDTIKEIIDNNQYSLSSDIFKRDYILNNVRMKVLNTKRNKEYLSNKVHFEILDLSFVYSVVVKETENVIQSFDISKVVLEDFQFTETELYQSAEKNMIESRMFQSMYEIMKSSFGFHCNELEESESEMFVLTNKEKINGAGVLGFSKILKDVSEKLGSNLYILPSSKHEVLILRSSEDINTIELREMVHMVNQTEVSEEDFLSDNVYMFLKDENMLMYA